MSVTSKYTSTFLNMPVKTYEMWCFTLHGDQAEAWRFAKHLGSIENKGYNTHTADGMLKTSNRNWVTYIALQAEAGEDLGGLHLQGYVQFKSGIDFPTAKKCFKFNDHQHHVMKCSGNDETNEAYCTSEIFKDKIKRLPLAQCVDLGPLWVRGQCYRYGERRTIEGSKDAGQGTREDINDLYTAILEGATWEILMMEHFGALSKCHVIAKQLYENVLTTKTSELYKRQMEVAVLRPWQSKIATYIMTSVPDPRAIHYVWEAEGNMGKTFLCTYLQSMHNALVLQAGKKADLAYIISQHYHKVNTIVFDLTRQTESGSVNVVWEICEALKGGTLISTKYQSTCLRVQPMHILICSNYAPPLRDEHGKATLSHDRWRVCHLTRGAKMSKPNIPLTNCWMTLRDKDSVDLAY